MQWVVQDERQAPFGLAAIVLDTSVQEGAKSAGSRVVKTHHRPSEEEAEDTCGGVDRKKQGRQGSRPEPGLLRPLQLLRATPCLSFPNPHARKTSNMDYVIHEFGR